MIKRKKRVPAARPKSINKSPIIAGDLTPTRTVPQSIVRPDYAESGYPIAKAPKDLRKDEETLERMRLAGSAARTVLRAVAAEIQPGITTDYLDQVCHEACLDLGGYPSPLNYNGYPKSLCTSVNEVICHGIPDSRKLENGDIINCDVTIFINGVHGDHSETFMVGEVDEASKKLIKVTREAMYLGIGAVESGGPVNAIGRAIQQHAEAAGYGVVREFIGHGVGEIFHHQPNIPHYYEPSATFEFQAGMTFTIEPMITLGSYKAQMWDDGWTATTIDLSRTAQFEHTILVHEHGVELLTVDEGEPQPFMPGNDKTIWPMQVDLKAIGQ